MKPKTSNYLYNNYSFPSNNNTYDSYFTSNTGEITSKNKTIPTSNIEYANEVIYDNNGNNNIYYNNNYNSYSEFNNVNDNNNYIKKDTNNEYDNYVTSDNNYSNIISENYYPINSYMDKNNIIETTSNINNFNISSTDNNIYSNIETLPENDINNYNLYNKQFATITKIDSSIDTTNNNEFFSSSNFYKSNPNNYNNYTEIKIDNSPNNIYDFKPTSYNYTQYSNKVKEYPLENKNKTNTYITNKSLYTTSNTTKILNTKPIKENKSLITNNSDLNINNISYITNYTKQVKVNYNKGKYLYNQNCLGKIKTKYLIKNIFDFIKYKNFMYKLFAHSKSFQKLLGINLSDYKRLYLSKKKFNLEHYFSGYNEEEKKYEDDFNKDTLKNNFETDKDLFNSVNIAEYAINYYNSKNDKIKSNIFIDIFSPFFGLFAKRKDFWEVFSIPVVVDEIEKKNLKYYYISVFDKINKANINYSLYLSSHSIIDINILKELKINFNQVKKIGIIINYEGDYDLLLKKMFSCNLINLNSLKIKLTYFPRADLLKGINDLKNLETLELEKITFLTPFELKLFNLKKLILNKCKNILLNQNVGLNLKHVTIQESEILSPNPLIKAPNLEIFEYPKYTFYYLKWEFKKINRIFDLSTSFNLKVFEGELSNFIELGNLPLEKVFISATEGNETKESIKKMLNIIIFSTTIKEIYLKRNMLETNDIKAIGEKNYNITKLSIDQEDKEGLIESLQNKFPNLNDLSFISRLPGRCDQLNIKEKKDSKIDKIKIWRPNNLSFYCAPFENLIKLDIYLPKGMGPKIEDIFPIFNSNCNIIFKFLSYFKFCADDELIIDINILKNIYNNLDKMPKLNNFQMFCTSFLKEDFANQIYQKLNSMNVNYFKIDVYFKSIYFRYNYPIGHPPPKYPEKKLSNGVDKNGNKGLIRIYKLINYED